MKPHRESLYRFVVESGNRLIASKAGEDDIVWSFVLKHCRLRLDAFAIPLSWLNFVAALATAWVILSGIIPRTTAARSAETSPQAQALLDEKASRTAAQRRIDSRLLLELKKRRGDPAMQAVPTLRSSIEVDQDGTTLVDIRADVTEDLLNKIEELDGTVVSYYPEYRAVRARLPLKVIEALADSPRVDFISPVIPPITNKINTSEGDGAHGADSALTRPEVTCDG